MTSLELAKTVSYDELMRLGSNARVEVINGEIREMPPTGVYHGIIYGNFEDIARPYVRSNRLGMVLGDGVIFLMLKPGETKHGLQDSYVPDASFTRSDRIPKDWNIIEPFPYAPTLAVEIMSPDDKAEDMDLKVQRYLEAGTEEVWVIYPKTRTLYQYRTGASTVRTYHSTEKIDCETLFPGLTISLSQLLDKPDFGQTAPAP